MRARVALLALVIAGCERAPAPPPPPSCEEVGTAIEAATAPDRHLLGHASPYPADASLRDRAEELARSQRARRAAAWDALARVLRPVELTEPTPAEGARVPRFRTWYDSEDFARLFRHAYEVMGPAGRASRARFDEAALDAAMGWNVDLVTTLPTWPASRWAEYVAALEDDAAVAGIGGVRRIALSPDAARHVMTSYPEVLRCLDEGAPPALAGVPADTTQRLAREAISIERCGARTIGPFSVARGGTLRARLDGEQLEGAELVVGSCTGTTECEVEGPGSFFVTVSADEEGLDAIVDVERTEPAMPLTACLDGPFPLASATVALEWRRVEPERPLAVYDTSAQGLARRLAEGEDATWGAGDATAEPGDDVIYTMRLPTGAVFRLAGMHVRTRELDHWLNITMWWSDRPDEDFGADRPDAIRALGGPWSSYKMCVAVEFDERDPDPRGGLDGSLGAALSAVHTGEGGPSWCSNPYIDAGPGLVRSNCVGCHQHAMSGVRPSDVARDERMFPEHGRALVRDNFPADQFWGLDGGDDLAAVIAETVSYWDAQE
ncbi:hypothetical protein [Sandaracinus amylolyticus]|uniref:Uncharacterized protein n=1 Tax=Sandaracinus amylolyticus TaxID=927083 RepID=A0A0F6YMA9_9BACT|nr:hypothetical protein [Sandaracinus amylolyticus]AKF10057.1 hypothetical protein DB32_007206 [Sandaracinus amylolyticus]